MAGAFVALAGGVTGFLPDSSGAKGRTEGEWLRVAVTRAAQGGKGPRLALSPPPEPLSGPPRLLARGPDAPLRLAGQYPDALLSTDSPASAARLRAALGARRPWAPGASRSPLPLPSTTRWKPLSTNWRGQRCRCRVGEG
jgi:hypothetical protein